MHRVFFTVCVGLILIWSAGCGPAARKAAPTAAVKGTVTLDGKAFDGDIIFDLPGEPIKEMKVSNGNFSGEAHVGKNKIKVSKKTMDGKPLDTDPDKKPTEVEHVDLKWNIATTLEKEVTQGGTNEFEFKVTSKGK